MHSLHPGQLPPPQFGGGGDPDDRPGGPPPGSQIPGGGGGGMQPDWATAAGGVKMEMRSPWDSPQSGGPPPGAQLSHHNSPFGCPPVPPPAVQQGLGQSLSNPQLAGSGPPNAGTPSGETSSSGSSTTVAAAAAAQQGSSSNYGQVGQAVSLIAVFCQYFHAKTVHTSEIFIMKLVSGEYHAPTAAAQPQLEQWGSGISNGTSAASPSATTSWQHSSNGLATTSNRQFVSLSPPATAAEW